MSLPLIIVNPESAGGATRKAWPKIASDLRTYFGAFRMVFTEGPGFGVSLAAEAARKGAKLMEISGERLVFLRKLVKPPAFFARVVRGGSTLDA